MTYSANTIVSDYIGYSGIWPDLQSNLYRIITKWDYGLLAIVWVRSWDSDIICCMFTLVYAVVCFFDKTLFSGTKSVWGDDIQSYTELNYLSVKWWIIPILTIVRDQGVGGTSYDWWCHEQWLSSGCPLMCLKSPAICSIACSDQQQRKRKHHMFTSSWSILSWRLLYVVKAIHICVISSGQWQDII